MLHDGGALVYGADLIPRVLNEVAGFILNLLETPQFMEDLVAATTREYDVPEDQALADITALLGRLVEERYVIEIPPGGDAPGAASPAPALLAEAFRQQQAGNGPAALALCVEARRDAAFSEIATLNSLIVRFRMGRIEGLIEDALALMPRLEPAGKLACAGLVLLCAVRTGDLELGRRIAVGLARVVSSPIDLPAPPVFALQVAQQIVLTEEGSVAPMLAALDRLSAQEGCSEEDRRLLAELTRRYERREAAMEGRA